MKTPREFGALVAPHGVWLVEYRAERDGFRLIAEWADRTHSESLDAALDRLLALLAARHAGKSRLSIVLDQFGTFHHTMALPAAADDVLRPVIQREVQRTFGLSNALVAYTGGVPSERREPPRADARTAPRQVFIAGGSPDTIGALQARLSSQPIDLRIVTIVPAALRQLQRLLPDAIQPTAAVAVLETGPHVAYFIGGELAVAIDPPIALEGEQPGVDLVVDQVDRGNVYLRQQFRGAAITAAHLTAKSDVYDLLVSALQDRLGLRVQPLMSGSGSPESLVAMGAALEGEADFPLSLVPRQPRWTERIRGMTKGGGKVVAAAAAAALVVGLWSALQFAELSRTRAQLARSNREIESSLPRLESLRAVAQRRADFASSVAYLRASTAERNALTAALADVANALPNGARVDSLHVSRTTTGWSGSLVGVVSGVTTGEAVRSLNTLFETIRARAGIASAALDEFDYAGEKPKSDSATASRDAARVPSDAPIVIRYHISFTLRRGASAS